MMELEETFCNPQYDWVGKGPLVAKLLGEKLLQNIVYAGKFQNSTPLTNFKVGGSTFTTERSG